MIGVLGLVRLCVRRDRIVLPLWVLVIGLLPLVYAVSFAELYPTTQDRVSFYEVTSRVSAQLAMVGPIFGSDLGALVSWRSGILLTMAPLAAILTVIRHSRAEEDAGRAELLGSTVVGRHAQLAAALLVAVGGVLAAGFLAAVSLVAYGLGWAGSFAFGLSVAAAGAVFAGIAAAAAQAGSNARTARSYALTALAVAFVLRAVGDAGSQSLSWASPIGWSSQLRPFAQERWWVLGLSLLATVVAVGGAFALAGRRDLGSGLVPERPGPAEASRSLRGAYGLAWHQHRTALLVWTVGLGLVGLTVGSAADEVEDQLGGGGAIEEMLAAFGGTTLVESFLAATISIIAIAAAAYSLTVVLRAAADEQATLAAIVLAGGVGRLRWLASHLSFAVMGPAAALLTAGLLAGLAYGIAIGDIGSVLPELLGAAAVQLPAIWVLTAAATVLFGLVPRHVGAVWILLIGCVLLGQVGSVVGLSQIWLDLSPFTHLPPMPGGSVTAEPLLWLTAVAVASGAFGSLAFRRRDIDG